MNVLLQSARRLKQRWLGAVEPWQTKLWCRRAGRLDRRPAPGGRALVLASGQHGSIGDEAMLLAVGSAAHARGIEHCTLVSLGATVPWPLIPGYDQLLDLSRRRYGDFQGVCRRWLEALQEATHFLIIGADMMDGHYSPHDCVRRAIFARMAQAAGVQTVVLGFSFNESPHPRAVSSLASLPPEVKLYARDPISLQRLREAIARPVDLSADVAFLLEPARQSSLLDDLRPWLAGERADGRLLVGVNANFLAAPLSMREDGGRPLAAALAAGLAAFADRHRNVSYLLIPHDYRHILGLPSDQDVGEAIAEAFPADLRAHTRVVPEPAHADEIKALAAELDLILTGRMHLAIAAIGCGTPAAGVVYQGKFEGLYQHLGLPPLCLDPASLHDSGAIAAFLLDLAQRRQEYAEIIRGSLPRIRELSARNFDALDPRPTAKDA